MLHWKGSSLCSKMWKKDWIAKAVPLLLGGFNATGDTFSPICTCKLINHLTCLVQLASITLIARRYQHLKDMTHSASAVGVDLFVCLVGFLTSSSTTRLYRGRAPRQERLTIFTCCHTWDRAGRPWLLSQPGGRGYRPVVHHLYAVIPVCNCRKGNYTKSIFKKSNRAFYVALNHPRRILKTLFIGSPKGLFQPLSRLPGKLYRGAVTTDEAPF